MIPADCTAPVVNPDPDYPDERMAVCPDCGWSMWCSDDDDHIATMGAHLMAWDAEVRRFSTPHTFEGRAIMKERDGW